MAGKNRKFMIAGWFYAGLSVVGVVAELHPQSSHFRFEHLSVAEGLSQNSVYCILQDRQGFMWFGAADGLNRYDGYEMVVYRHDPADPHSISDNTIRGLAEDGEGNLWIATDRGVNKWDRQEGKFYRFLPDTVGVDTWHSTDFYANGTGVVYPGRSGIVWVGALKGLYALHPATGEFRLYRPPELRDDIFFEVKKNCRGRKGSPAGIAGGAGHSESLWIGTAFGGLYRFDPQTGRLFPCPLPAIDPPGITITDIMEDRAGNLWIATWEHGLWKYQPHTNTFTGYRHDPKNPFSLSDDQALAICEDSAGFLWVGAENGGLNRLDPQTGKFTRFLHRQGDPHGLSANRVSSLFCDRSGLLWIGTDGGGVNKLDPRPPKFAHYHAGAESDLPLCGNFLKAIYEGRPNPAGQRELWSGAYGGGLCRIELESGRATSFRADPANSNSLSNDNVNCILWASPKGQAIPAGEDRAGILWIGTDKGLNRFDPSTGRFTHYLDDAVRTLLEDRRGNIWIGSPGLGKIHPDSSRGPFTWYHEEPATPNSLGDDWVWALHESADGLLWIGTNDGGLNCFDPRTERFVHYLHDPQDSTSISNNTVRTIYEDPRQAGQILWIGTENGLNKFDRETGKFIRYYEKHGLPNGFIYGILEDDAGLPGPAARDSRAGGQAGNLWISTNRGLSRFNLQTETFRNYGPEDGLQSYEFNTGAYFKNERGEMFFGGVNGLNVFHPDSVRDNPHLPAVVLTGFKKFDRPADLGRTSGAYEEYNCGFQVGVGRCNRIRHPDQLVHGRRALADSEQPCEFKFPL